MLFLGCSLLGWGGEQEDMPYIGGVAEGGCGGKVVRCGRCTLPGPGKIWEGFPEEAQMKLRAEEGAKVSRQMLWGSRPWRLEVPTPEPGAE